MQQDANCYGQVFPAFSVGMASFTSANTSICNPLFNSGTITGAGPGGTNIFAGWTADTWSYNVDFCQYTPAEALRDALCNVLPVDFIDVSLVGTNRTAQFFLTSATLNIDSCGGERFSIKVRFKLPSDSASCCSNPATSKVTLPGNNKFEFAPDLIDGTIYDFFGNDNPPFVTVYLRRRADEGGTNNTVAVTVSGTYGNGEDYSGQGLAHLACP